MLLSLVWLQSGVKKAHDYDMEGGTPSHPAFSPDGSGFHPMTGPSMKKLPPSAVATPIPENGAEATIGTIPAADSPVAGKDGISSHTSTSGSTVDFKDARPYQTRTFSPMSNHLASLNLQGSHPTRR